MKNIIATLLAALTLAVSAQADNFTFSQGSGKTGGSDTIAGVDYSRVKVIVGADGTNDGDVSSANPMPVTVTPGSAAASLGKVEDSAAASGDTGVFSLCVANEAGSNLAADADYIANACTRKGARYVTIDGTYQPSNATGLMKPEDAAHSSADNGIFPLSVRTDTAASSAGTTGDYAALTTGALGQLHTQDIGGTANGATLYSKISTANNNSTSIKGSAGQVYSVQACNINAAVRYLKLYNTASAPTCGTDVPVMRIAIPGATTGGCTPNIALPIGGVFSTGIGICIVTGITDADNTSTAASEQLVNISYK